MNDYYKIILLFLQKTNNSSFLLYSQLIYIYIIQLN